MSIQLIDTHVSSGAPLCFSSILVLPLHCEKKVQEGARRIKTWKILK